MRAHHQQQNPTPQQLLDWTLRLWHGDQTVLDELRSWCRVFRDGDQYVLVGPGAATNFSLEQIVDVQVLGLQLGCVFYGFSWPAEFKGFLQELQALSQQEQIEQQRN